MPTPRFSEGECRAAEPDLHNAPVEEYGPLDARFLLIGLAPGRSGANRTGRPFIGDATDGYPSDMLGCVRPMFRSAMVIAGRRSG